MTKAIYAGSFDPVTVGHIDIIKRSILIVDDLVLAIGVNPGKKTLFSEEERIEMLKKVVSRELPSKRVEDVEVISFQGLLVNLAKSMNAKILIRGIRSVSDFEYEINLANVNKTIYPGIETIFLPTSPDMAVVSSSAVKEIAKYGGDISRFAPSYLIPKILSEFGFIKFGEG